MKDIDFDELDRAVNSLIGGTPDAPAAVVPEIASTATPVEPTIPPVSVPVRSTPIVPAEPLAARRASGRFMDVVHPSSDMRSSTPVTAMTTVNTPANVPEAAPAAAVAPIVSAVADAPAAVPAPAPIAPMINTPSDEDGDITKIADEITASMTQDPVAPLESPFIADAKVEKRPLGAFSADSALAASVIAVASPSEPTPVATPAPEPLTPPSSAPEVPLAAPATSEKPTETDTPLPAELQNDLLSIESNETASASTPEAQFVPPAAPSTDVVPTPTSITQQYTEVPSTGDKPTTTLFDSAAYKKPTGKAKKRSSWFVILWILLLIIVGGGIGAAVYFFVLPML